jgi:FG-GAP-like repeat/FG-GAP repeat
MARRGVVLVCLLLASVIVSGGATASTAARSGRQRAAAATAPTAGPPTARSAAATLRFSSSDLTVGYGPVRLIAADLNGDGHADLASVDWSASTISVLLGTGNGGFARRVAYRTPRHPEGVTAADINHDGALDLLVPSADRAGSIWILLNTGAGRFKRQPGRAISGPRAYAVAAADLDGDGRVDLVIAHKSRRTLTVLKGERHGRFKLVHRYNGGGALDVALGDFNGDGRVDAAFVEQGFVVVRLGHGDGSFGFSVRTKTHGQQPWNLVVSDFNHDGKLDVATGNRSDAVSVFLGNGDGTFVARRRDRLPVAADGSSAYPDAVTVADFDRDGNPDIAGSAWSGPFVLQGRGNGAFLPAQSVDHSGDVSGDIAGTIGAATADFNGDGWPDLAVIYAQEGEGFPDVLLYLNRTGQPPSP